MIHTARASKEPEGIPDIKELGATEGKQATRLCLCYLEDDCQARGQMQELLLFCL